MKKILIALFAFIVSINCFAISFSENGYSSYSPNNTPSYYEQYYNRSFSLKEQLSMAEDEIYELKEEIKELKYEIEDKDDEIQSLHSLNVGLWIAVSVLFIIVVALIIFKYRK